MKKTYTLDRFDDFFGFFLLSEDKTTNLLIPKRLIEKSLEVGSLVEIQRKQNHYEIVPLK